MKQEDLYKTEEGFKTSLTGVYIQVAGSTLYGRDMSFYFTDYLAQLWTPAASTATNRITDYKIPNWMLADKDVEPVIERIWKAYYTAIVQLNDILGSIDDARSVFMNHNYELIKGEALGLRAFLHLDLLRLFGPIPGGDAVGKLAIPYAEEKTRDPNRLVTLPYENVTAKIIRDLDAAEKLLENVDPLLESDNFHLNNADRVWADDWTPPVDLWQTSRQLRFNYYAVLGAKARYYHWIGEKADAVAYAKKVIESQKFRLVSGNDYISTTADYGKNLLMLSEHLFGVHNSDLQSVIQPYFKAQLARLTANINNITNYVYENNTSELRNTVGTYWVERAYEGTTMNHFLKYGGNTSFSDINKVPVLRLCEMYFIVVEDSPQGEFSAYYDEYVDSRMLPPSYKSELISEDKVLERLAKEYRKEFYGEGQTFFFYKKHRYTAIPRATASGNFTIPADFQNFEIPRPKSQTVFD
jgi:hypothetical protein